MAANIPDSRLGRALRAGIPVALILLGAELLEGTWKVERSEEGVALSWSPPSHRDAAMESAVQLVNCAKGRCETFTLPLSLQAPHIGSGMLALADTMTGFLWRDCPERRAHRIDAFLG